ncbi:MAG: PAS domain S-box protein [bacterium]
MKMFLNLSIKSKIILIILIVTSITIWIGFTIITINDINTYQKDLVSSTTVNAKLIGEYCIVPLTFRDHEEATKIIEKIKSLPSLTTVCIYDENGDLFASFQKMREEDIPASIIPEEKFVFENDNLKVFTPIKFNDIIYGTVYIKVSTDLLSEKINQHLIIMLLLMLGLMIFSYFIASKLQAAISKPILNLARTANRITQVADYSVRVKKQGEDEIGLLYDSFNGMLKQLSTREEQRNKAEKLLLESEAKYRRIVDTATEGIWLLGEDTLTKFVNNRMAEMLGYSCEEIEGRPVTDFMFEEDVPDHLRKMENRRQGISENYERRFYRKDNQTVWTHVSGTPVLDDGNHFKGAIAMFTDITERKLSEEKINSFIEDEKLRNEELILKNIELKKARIATLNIIEDLSLEIAERQQAEQRIAQLAAIVEYSDDAIIGKDLDGNITSWNKGAENIYGYSQEEIIGQPVSIIIPEPYQDEINLIYKRIKQGEHIKHFETMRLKKNGILFNVSLTISPVYNSDGEIIGISIIGRDITERKQAEQKIKENEERLRALINSTPDIICFKDGKGRWLEANESDLELFCLKNVDYHGKTDSDLAEFTDPIYREAFLTCESTDEKAWLSGGITQSEETIPRSDGVIKIYDVIKVPIFESDGSRKGLVVLGRDITERKQVEKSLHLLNRRLRAISDCNQALLHAEDELILLKEVCEIICDKADYKMAWVGYAENDIDQTIRPIAWAGDNSSFIVNAKLSWSDVTEHGQCPAGIAIRTGKIVSVQDFETDPITRVLPKSELKRGYRSCMALPLKDENANVFGALLVYSTEVNSITPDEIELMDELSNDLAFGINSLRARAERRKAIEALKTSEERFAAAFKLSPIAIAIFSAANGEFIDVNETFVNSSGYTRHEIIGHTTSELNLFADPGDREIILRELMEKGLLENFEFRTLNKSGKIGYALNSTTIINIGGSPHYLSLILDITDRKRAEEALIESEGRYRMVFENSPVSIWEEDFSNVKILFDNLRKEGITDIEAHLARHPEIVAQCAGLIKIIDINKAALELHNAKNREVLVNNLVNTFTTESFDTFKHELICLWSGRTEMLRDAKVMTLTGEPRNVTVYFSVAPGYEESLSKVIVSIIDITERKKAEESLQHINETLRATLEAAPVAIFDLDTKGHVKSLWNKAATQMLGWERDEVIGNYLPTVTKDQKEEFKSFLAIMQEGKSILGLDVVRQRKDGSPIEYSLFAAPEYDDKNKVIGNVAVLVDITERRKSEAELRRVLHAIEQSPVSVVMTNSEGNIEYVNPRFTENTGYKKDEVLGKNPRILKSGEMDAKAYKHLWDTISAGKEWHGEFHNKKKNGELFWEVALISPVRNDKGIITHYVAIKEDITEQKRVQKALKESEEQYRILVTTVPDIIIRTDINGDIIFVNETVLSTFFNKSPEKIIGQNILSFVCPEDRERAIQNTQLMFNEPLGLKEYKLKFDDTEIECEVNGDILRDSEGNPNGMVYVMREITARKRAEKELENYRQRLEDLIKERTHELEGVNRLLQDEIKKQIEAEEKVKLALEKEKELSEMKSKFISLASHEFRTPLTTVFSSTELLERYGRGWDIGKYTNQTERIKKSVKYLTNLMDDVLTISRAETGKIKFEPTLINLEEICKNILDDINFIISPNHRMNYSIELKESWIIIDEKLFKFIVMNLLTNAIKYSPNGGEIVFKLKAKRGNLIIEISDEGMGIPEIDQRHLFEPFHRGSNVGEIRGTGLGMSIIKRSVDMHQGTIDFISVLTKGTKFTVSLPFKKVRKK